jgi:hypothetical protein
VKNKNDSELIFEAYADQVLNELWPGYFGSTTNANKLQQNALQQNLVRADQRFPALSPNARKKAAKIMTDEDPANPLAVNPRAEADKKQQDWAQKNVPTPTYSGSANPAVGSGGPALYNTSNTVKQPATNTVPTTTGATAPDFNSLQPQVTTINQSPGLQSKPYTPVVPQVNMTNAIKQAQMSPSQNRATSKPTPAPKTPTAPTTPAATNDNPPGTMLSRGLARLGKGLGNLKFKSPDREMMPYGGAGGTGAAMSRPATKPSYKPLFSKGGVFNR